MENRTGSDEEIWARVRRDDENALQELLRKYYSRLGDFSFSMLRRRDLADEAVSNVFLNMWRRRATLTIKTTVRSYLFAAVGNQSLTLRRRQLQHATVGLEEMQTRDLVDASSSDSEILYREFREEIDAVLARLPPQRQLVFRMKRLDGLPYAEIAKALDVSEHTVQNHMVQAIKQLAQELPRLRGALERNTTATPFG